MRCCSPSSSPSPTNPPSARTDAPTPPNCLLRIASAPGSGRQNGSPSELSAPDEACARPGQTERGVGTEVGTGGGRAADRTSALADEVLEPVVRHLHAA